MLVHDPSDESVDVHVVVSSANVSCDDRIDDDINNDVSGMEDDARRVASRRLLQLGIMSSTY